MKTPLLLKQRGVLCYNKMIKLGKTVRLSDGQMSKGTKDRMEEEKKTHHGKRNACTANQIKIKKEFLETAVKT